MPGRAKTNTRSIDEVLAIRFAGNFAQDQEKYEQISLFVQDEDQPMEDRAKALQHWYKNGMGITEAGGWEGDEEEVQKFVAAVL